MIKYMNSQRTTTDCGLVAIYNLLRWLDRRVPSYKDFYKQAKKDKLYGHSRGMSHFEVSTFLHLEDVRSTMMVDADIKDVEGALNKDLGVILMFKAFRNGETACHFVFIKGHDGDKLDLLNPLDTGANSKTVLSWYIEGSRKSSSWPAIMWTFRREQK